jgi:hypothetical protein
LRRKKLFLRLVIALVICGVIAAAVPMTIRAFHDARDCATLGSCMSISAALSSEIRDDNPHVVFFFANATEERQFLTPEQCDELMEELAKEHDLDAPRGWEPSEPLVDLWGNRIEVGYRLLPDGRCGLTVLSRGRDGVLGTKHDVAAAEIPETLESSPELGDR